ncbi:MAG TPA: hypothetical protein VMY06_05575 [Sedimentisphaerales bacterium]|nr:hypothetical protein [Sedimentisphaerales bacterium]
MSGDIKNYKEEAEKLNRLGRLVDRYAQSRSLGLLLPITLLIINALLTIGAIELVSFKVTWWTCTVLVLVTLWVVCSSTWLAFKLVPKYEYSFYRKDGEIKLEREKVPVWAWGAYLITACGATLLSAFDIMPVRWALTLVLVILAVFVLYVSGKEKNKISGIVFSILMFVVGILTASGTLSPFAEKGWLCSFFVPLMIYIAAAGLMAMVVVHIYNRRILRKIKEVRPFGEQEAGKPDS